MAAWILKNRVRKCFYRGNSKVFEAYPNSRMPISSSSCKICWKINSFCSMGKAKAKPICLVSSVSFIELQLLNRLRLLQENESKKRRIKVLTKKSFVIFWKERVI